MRLVLEPTYRVKVLMHLNSGGKVLISIYEELSCLAVKVPEMAASNRH